MIIQSIAWALVLALFNLKLERPDHAWRFHPHTLNGGNS